MKNILVLSGPSGAGKTVLREFVTKNDSRFLASVSATNREPREGEIPGEHYHFFSKEGFDQKISDGSLLEWEEVYAGRKYGTLRSEIARIQKAGRIPALVLDVMGALKLKELYGDEVLTIIVCPPSLEILRERLVARKSEKEAELEKRLAKVPEELSYRGEFDIALENGSLEKVEAELSQIIRQYF